MNTSPVERDVAYELLGHPVRRAVVAAGRTLDAPASLSRTADAVMNALTTPADGTGPGTPAVVPNLELRLHHTHLPKLDAAGVIAYDAARQTVVDVDEEAAARLSKVSETLVAECGDALAVE